MKNIVAVFFIILFSLQLSGCNSYFDPFQSFRHDVDFYLTTKSVNESHADNIKNKNGPLIKIKYRRIHQNGDSREAHYFNGMTAYFLHVSEYNDSVYINNYMSVFIEHIPINDGRETEVYLTVHKGYRLSDVSVPGGSIITSYDNKGKTAGSVVSGKSWIYKDKFCEIEVTPYFTDDQLYMGIRGNM